MVDSWARHGAGNAPPGDRPCCASCLAILLAAAAAPAPAAWLGDGAARPPVVTVDAADPAALRVTVTVPGVLSTTVAAEGRTWARIALPGGYPPLEAGEPDLPVLPVHLAIPGRGTPVVTVTNARWREVTTARVLPSRGNLPRTLAPPDSARWCSDRPTPPAACTRRWWWRPVARTCCGTCAASACGCAPCAGMPTAACSWCWSGWN